MSRPTQPGAPGRPPAVLLLVGLLLVQGLSGLAGGFGLIGDPTGEALGIPVEWLEGSPFRDYLIPGIVLFVVLGLEPLVVARAVWFGRPWSPPAAGLVGAALVVWIAVQILVIGYQARPPLQAVYGTLGVLLVGVSVLPSVRRFSTNPSSPIPSR